MITPANVEHALRVQHLRASGEHDYQPAPIRPLTSDIIEQRLNASVGEHARVLLRTAAVQRRIRQHVMQQSRDPARGIPCRYRDARSQRVSDQLSGGIGAHLAIGYSHYGGLHREPGFRRYTAGRTYANGCSIPLRLSEWPTSR